MEEPFEHDFEMFLYISDKDRFQRALTRYYEIKRNEHKIKCMISGISFPSEVVIATHLFKLCWADDCEQVLGFKDINNPRNGLLMFEPFAYAYNNSHICFLHDTETNEFKLKILYHKLKEMTIREYIETEMDTPILSQSRQAWMDSKLFYPRFDMKGYSTIVDNLLNVLEKPFSDFEGTPIIFKSKRCFKRCLTFQAQMAHRMALKKDWINKSMVPELNDDRFWLGMMVNRTATP